MVRWQKEVFVHTRLSLAYLALARLSCFDMTIQKTQKVAFLDFEKTSIRILEHAVNRCG